MYLLDTNICAYFIRARYPSITAKVREHGMGGLGISSIVAAELAYGVEHSARVESNRVVLAAFLRKMTVLPWTEEAMWHFGREKSRLRRLGKPISDIDLLLGCQAVALDAVFVTNNTREFERIDGLKLENWVE